MSELTTDDLIELLGVQAARWLDCGVVVTRGSFHGRYLADEVTVHHDGRAIGFTAPSPAFAGLRTYYVIVTDGMAVPFPAGFLALDPLAAQRSERARWLPIGHPDRPADAPLPFLPHTHTRKPPAR